jgi:hypothetical protein
MALTHPVPYRLGPQAGHLPQRQDQPQLAPDHQPQRAADHPGDLPRPRLHPCPDRVRCTRSPVLARHLTFRPRTQYETQQQLRAEQATDAWQKRYAHRAGVEGTIAQATRRSDLHQARYRGLAKTHLQHILTALALNLVRLDAWLTGIPPGGSWASRLTRLRPAPAPT